jgi:hypothetical protein
MPSNAIVTLRDAFAASILFLNINSLTAIFAAAAREPTYFRQVVRHSGLFLLDGKAYAFFYRQSQWVAAPISSQLPGHRGGPIIVDPVYFMHESYLCRMSSMIMDPANRSMSGPEYAHPFVNGYVFLPKDHPATGTDTWGMFELLEDFQDEVTYSESEGAQWLVGFDQNHMFNRGAQMRGFDRAFEVTCELASCLKRVA